MLARWSEGERECLDQLLPLVHAELHRIARRYMRKERPDHTLQTTALLNEAYLRLIDHSQIAAQNRTQFFALAAQIMRHVLVDHARERLRGKRGRGAQHVLLDEALVFSPHKSAELVALDESLTRLASFDARKAQVVELRYFGGMSVEEVAEVLQVHPNTVIHDWRLAKAWLKDELTRA